MNVEVLTPARLYRVAADSRARAGGRLLGCAVSLALLGAPAAHAEDSLALADAARGGDVARVSVLLDARGADVDARGRHGMTALLWAAQADDVALVRLLLEAGADPNLGNRYGITPLWLAATNHNLALVDLLLEHGADASVALPHGETALMAAARAGDAETVARLIEAGADPNAHESSLGETALMWAAGENHEDAVRALVAGGADPDAHSKVLELGPMNWDQTGMVSTTLPVGGWTALMIAARQNADAAARALVDLGADLDAQDPDGTTALAVATMNAHYDLAAWLLEAGADPNVADRAGMTALYTAVDMVSLGREIGRPDRPNMSTLGAIDVVRLALAEGADPNARLTGPTIPRHHGFPDRSLSAGATALMRAARGYDAESLRELLEAGGDATLTQADGSNAVMSFAGGFARAPEPTEPQRETLRLLLEAGADVNVAGREGETPLHRAARGGNAAVVTLLAEHGANLDARDTAGRTPLDIVAQPGRTQNEAIAALLRKFAEQP